MHPLLFYTKKYVEAEEKMMKKKKKIGLYK